MFGIFGPALQGHEAIPSAGVQAVQADQVSQVSAPGLTRGPLQTTSPTRPWRSLPRSSSRRLLEHRPKLVQLELQLAQPTRAHLATPIPLARRPLPTTAL